MRCPNCHSDNPEFFRFCKDCGSPLNLKIKEAPSEVPRTRKLPLDKLPPGSLFADRYQIIEELGSGGMGRVYKVLDKELDTVIVLKVLLPEVADDPETIPRFRNELRLSREISHTNVCRMFDLNMFKRTYYITMEYVDGESLKNIILMTKKLSVATAIAITKQICEGLGEAHRHGVVHRDLKPGNILIDRDGNAKILDFGLARSIESQGITATGIIIGTPQYMSPEQVQEKTIDQRSDIYSLGVLLYEMLTGHVPFDGDSPVRVALRHVKEKPLEPKDLNLKIPQSVSRVILKCLAKEKEDRYQSTQELLAELIRIEKTMTKTKKDDFMRKKRTAGSGIFRIRKKGIVLGSLVILAGLLVALVIGFLGRGGGRAYDSIAVLPFKLENVEPDQGSEIEYLADGITESIISKLDMLPGLKKVIARSSVFQYKGMDIDPLEVGRELGVDSLLGCRLSQFGDELSIIVELVDTTDNRRIWGDKYQVGRNQIFEVQDNITNSITENLRLELTGEERERIAKRYTESSEAFKAYARGQYLWNKRTESDLRMAIAHFEEALRIDPNYALAHTGLSLSYLLLPEYGNYFPRDGYQKAKEYALRALQIDPELAEARTSLAQLRRRYDWDWDAAEREYNRALELDPNYAMAYHWYGYDLMCMARYDEAIQMIERAHELDPLSLVINRNVGQIYYRSGQFERGEEALQRVLAKNPNFSYLHYHLGNIRFQQGQYAEALSLFQREKENARGWALHIQPWIGMAYAKQGMIDHARTILSDLISQYEKNHVPPTSVAALFFVLGDIDEGFLWLEKAYERYDSWIRLLKTDTVFDPVREDPRFLEILKKIGLEK
jgi:serine/threonine protein kinase/tetratricopeptide (TPR) repeat protein